MLNPVLTHRREGLRFAEEGGRGTPEMTAGIGHRGGRAVPWLIAVLGTLLSVAAFSLARSYDEGRVRALFDQRADWEVQAIDRRLRALLEPLAPLALFFGRQEEETAGLLEQFGLQARGFGVPVRRLSWTPRVADADREAFVAARRSEGRPDYDILELTGPNAFGPAARRGEYFPILHEVVFDATISAMGFDVASDPDRLGAVERAVERGIGTAAIAPPSTGGVLSMVVRWPVFEGGRVPSNAQERRLRLRGFVNAVFDPLEVLQEVLAQDVALLAAGIRSGRHAVAHWDAEARRLRPGGPPPDGRDRLMLQRNLIVYGMPLGLALTVDAAAAAAERSYAPWPVLALGLALTAAAAGYAARAEGERRRGREVQAAVEAALARSEERFRDFAEAASDWLWETDALDRISWISEASLGKRGVDTSLVLGRPFAVAQAVGPDDPDGAEVRRAMQAREAFQDQIVARREPGLPIRYVRVAGRPRFDAGGGFLGYRGTASNVTEEQLARRQMRLAQERLQDAIETLPCGFLLFDPEERLVAANAWTRGVLDRLGVAEAGATAELFCGGIVTCGLLRADGEDPAARRAARLARFRSGTRNEEEEWADGRWYQVIQRRTASGNSVCLYFDVTERRQAEAQLRQSQRMEAMGQLTGGIAHDFNNLLLVIIVSLDLLRDGAALEPPFPALVENAHAAATRAADLTRRLLAFARQQPLQSRAIDLAALVEGMHGLLKRTLGPTIGIDLSLPPDLGLAGGDQGQMENALLNLAINARDAMPRGGRLRIACFNHRGPPAEGMAEGDYVALAVTDTGTGMEAEVARRAFDPFFTTKPVGKGTGLGLSMIYGFARQSGGHVALRTAPGEGTTVTIYLPRAPAVEAGAAEEAPAAAEAGHETILVVDDDADVRATAVQLIGQLGYAVLEAGDGPAALALIEAHPEIALLFTDVVMPGGMRGDELAAAARAIRPGLKVLMSSGNMDLGPEPGAAPDGSDFIAKPYRARALAARLREALG